MRAIQATTDEDGGTHSNGEAVCFTHNNEENKEKTNFYFCMQ